MSSLIEHADALDWLPRQPAGRARAVVYDPPYSRFSPMRGREDGAAGSVAAPFSFMKLNLDWRGCDVDQKYAETCEWDDCCETGAA